jgi:hypothetical protein
MRPGVVWMTFEINKNVDWNYEICYTVLLMCDSGGSHSGPFRGSGDAGYDQEFFFMSPVSVYRRPVFVICPARIGPGFVGGVEGAC